MGSQGWRRDLRPLERGECPVRGALQDRAIETQVFALPPLSGLAFGLKVGEPVLPKYRANFERWHAGKPFGLEKREHGGIILQQQFFRANHPKVILPLAE